MGPLAAGVTRLKSSLHEMRAYPSQRAAAVNLLSARRGSRRFTGGCFGLAMIFAL